MEQLSGDPLQLTQESFTRKRSDSFQKGRPVIHMPTLNRNLLPLKVVLFFFNGASFALLPYLTIHMKDIGINDVDIALMYAILPFCVFIAPPIVGFMADKLGNYVRVLYMGIFGCIIFYSLLLAVPTNLHKVTYPKTELQMEGKDVNLTWQRCPGGKEEGHGCTFIRNPAEREKDPIPIYFELNSCEYDCTKSKFDLRQTLEEYKFLGLSITKEDVICNHIGRKHCKVWPGTNRIEFIRVNTNVSGNTQCGRANIDFYTDSDPCVTNNLEEEIPLGIMDSCSMKCKVRTNLVPECGSIDSGNRLITNGVYFIFRMIATMSLASCLILLDAQTIRMCELEERHGQKGAYGRQIIYKTLAQAVISPTVGALMDYISALEGAPNYAAPFIIQSILLIIALAGAYKINMDLELPRNKDSIKGIKNIFLNIEIMVFLFMMFVCGVMYGFVETFLFVFLKEDLHAPIYLLGLTITTGAVIAVPFLYYSNAIVKKIGCDRVIVLALLMYAVRYLGYSFVNCAWYAFPFEGLEVFTFFLLQVGAAEFIKDHAPPGLLATLSGLMGGAHLGFGKGLGGLLGGVLIEYTKSTHRAFWYFGVTAFVCSIFYASFVSLFMVKRRMAKSRNLSRKEDNNVNMEPDLDNLRKRHGSHPANKNGDLEMIEYANGEKGTKDEKKTFLDDADAIRRAGDEDNDDDDKPKVDENGRIKANGLKSQVSKISSSI